MIKAPRPLPKKCPKCGAGIVLSRSSGPYGDSKGWSCAKGCGAFGGCDYEHPDITKGRNMAKDFKEVPAFDERLTSLSCNVQLGILRQLHQEREEKK